MTTAIICTAILGALVFGLGANVTRIRASRGKDGGTQVPTDPADALLKASRAHGNAAEYVPTLAVLILLVASREPTAWAAALAIGATSSRVLHAFGMLTAPSLAVPTPSKIAGATGTYLFGLALAVTAATTVT